MKNIYQGELWFLGWKADHKGNRTVTFELPDDEALECFKGMTAKKGKMAGQILMAVLVEIDESDNTGPVQSKTTEESNSYHEENDISRGTSTEVGPVQEKLKGGPLSKLAGMWSNDSKFHEFLAYEYPESELLAAEFIRDFCEVKSRAEIDHDIEASKKFHKLRHEFKDWLDA